jgi:hypothetical protein
MAAALVLGAALTACRTPVVRGNFPVQLDDYPDVPVPAAMVRDREHSLRLETPVVGTLVNVYRGGGIAVDALTNHFMAQMPPLGWRLVSRFEQEATILVFEKNGALAFLGIGPDQGSATLSVLVGNSGGLGGPAPAQRN